MQKTFSPRPDPRPVMGQAIERAIELSAGSKRYSVTGGKLIYEGHRQYRYNFLLQSPWDLTDGTDLQLQSIDFKQLPVQLSNTEDERVTIITTQHLPDRTLASAQLVVDRAYMLRKMKDGLDPLKTSATPARLGLKLYSHLDCPDKIADSSQVDLIRDVFVPDEAQRLAIQRGLASEVLVILGPPGTGKTDVLTAIALLHARLSKKRILICSHTNVTIDNAIIRLVAFIRNHGLSHWIDEQRIVRYGTPHLIELEDDSYRNVTMPLIVADAIQQQQEEIVRLEGMREKIRDQMKSDQEDLPTQRQAWELRKKAISREREQVILALERLEAEERHRLTLILEELKPLLEKQQHAEWRMDEAKTTWLKDAARLQPLQQDYELQLKPYQAKIEKLEKLDEYRGFRRSFVQFFKWEKKLNAKLDELEKPLNKLAEQIEPIRQQQAEAKGAYEDAAHEYDGLQPAIAFCSKQRDTRPANAEREKSERIQEFAELNLEFLAGNPRIAELEQAIEKGRQDIGLIEKTLAHLDQQMIDAKREASRKVVESAQIVGVTLTALYMNPFLLNQEWDVGIIDEGSMTPPPAVMVVANRVRSHLIFGGDPHQLAPICKLKDPKVKSRRKEDDIVQLWLGNDVFFHGGYTLEEAATGLHHSVLLPNQGRMDREICDLIRGPVYKGRLKDRNPHKVRPKIGPERENPVVLYDTSGSRQARAMHPASKQSRYNPYHAEISVHLARLALADFPEEQRKPECIGIVTPYAAHRDVIKDLVRGTELEIFSRIGTVHAFQGLEFSALIFDLVDSPGLKIAPFLKGGHGSEAMRLLNVGVTRAKDKLLIVANMDYIRAEPSGSILRQITELACQKKCIPAEQLFIVR